MIERSIAPELLTAAQRAPIVVVTGPRQSGKTTLCRALFGDRPYINLEAFDKRAFALEDPRGFLASIPDGAVIDEVQRAPDLLSYLQEEVDRDPRSGRFILTGSENFTLSHHISQSLAGRVAVLVLLPPSYDELRHFPGAPTDVWELLVRGSFPRPYDMGIDSRPWLADYVTTYVERDVRDLLAVTDLVSFRTFLALVAGSTATEWNAARIGADVGIAHPTAKRWLSVLETSHLLMRLPPLRRNLRKRLVKAPKIHLLDSGLACHLLGIESADQLVRHPLRGAIFESWVVSEVLKALHNRGERPRLFHYRDASRLEVDLVIEHHGTMHLCEVKSAATVTSSFLESLAKVDAVLRESHEPLEVARALIYGGERRVVQSGVNVTPWSEVGTLLG